MSARKKKRVLFVCSGNYYRSRLAEILFNHEAEAAKLPWAAESRGLIKADDLKGLSPHVLAYLRGEKIEIGTPRNPLPIEVEDLTDSDLVVAMCQQEHQPMIEQKFMALAKALLKAGRLRYWKVYDIPLRPQAIVRLLGGGHRKPSQPADSGTNHITLAVRDLVRELAAG